MKALLLCTLFAAGTLSAADVTTLLQQGDDLDAKLQTQAALKVYLEAEQAAPENADVLQRIAKEYGLSMNDVDSTAEKTDLGNKALAYARRAVAADPKNANAQLALSISYGRVANLLDNKTKISYAKLVKEHAEIALALDPKNDLTYHVLGAWNYEMANLNPIVRAIAKAMYGEMPPASNEDAIRYLKKAVALNPDRMGNHVELGLALTAAGQKDDARAQFQQALSMPNKEKDDANVKQRAKVALAKLS